MTQQHAGFAISMRRKKRRRGPRTVSDVGGGTRNKPIHEYQIDSRIASATGKNDG